MQRKTILQIIPLTQPGICRYTVGNPVLNWVFLSLFENEVLLEGVEIMKAVLLLFR